MSNRYPIDITLYARPGAATPDVDAVKNGVEQGLAGLWPALGLPTTPDLTVRLSADPADLFEFTLQVGRQWAPVPVLQAGQDAPLVFRILCALFDRRTQLIDDEHLRQLRQECVDWEKTPSSWSSAPLPVWRALAETLLENGFGLHRLSACLERWSPEKKPRESFERLIENIDSLTIALQVGQDPEPGPDWRNHFPDLYLQMYQDLGILLPQIQVESAPELPAGQFRLRLNDLWLPVLPGTPPQATMYDSPGFILDWVRYWVYRYAGWYVNAGILDAQLDTLEANNRSLVVMIREQWPTYRLCGILRALLAEGVSIRNLPEVLDVLLRVDGPVVLDDSRYIAYFPPAVHAVVVPPGAPPAEFTDAQWADQVRANLKFPVAFPYMKEGVLPCCTLDQAPLRDFRDGFFQRALPEPGSAFYHLLKNIVQYTQTDPRLVLLTPSDNRSAVQKTLRPYFPHLAVLGHEDIPPFFAPRIIANITTEITNP